MKSYPMEIEVFEAFDGAIFYDDAECKMYEEKQPSQDKLENSKLWDSRYKGILLEEINDLESFLFENETWILNMMSWSGNDET